MPYKSPSGDHLGYSMVHSPAKYGRYDQKSVQNTNYAFGMEPGMVDYDRLFLQDCAILSISIVVLVLAGNSKQASSRYGVKRRQDPRRSDQRKVKDLVEVNPSKKATGSTLPGQNQRWQGTA